MMNDPTHYQFVRDREAWDAALVALERDVDGNLTLARLPGPVDGQAVDLPAPWAADPSGIAAGPCAAVFVADTDHNRVLFVDGTCAARAWLPATTTAGSSPGQFDHPRGLAVSVDGLWVADTGNRRIQRFAFPELEPDLDVLGGLLQPTGVATDSQGRLYVLDRGLALLRRYTRHGLPDPVYDLALAASGRLPDPLFLAVGEGDLLYVCDGAASTVRCFDEAGAFVRDLATPLGAWQPGALTFGAGRLFVADALSGQIMVFLADGSYCCELPLFRGPVSALALTDAGDLLIKTGLDDSYLTFAAGKSYASAGSATSGPYDAGDKLEWFRAAAEAGVPHGTAVVLEVAQWEAPGPPPDPGDWVRAAALDTLLANLLPPGPPPTLRRFLWMRATLSTLQPALSPVLHNLRAETPGEDYRDYLPEIYRRSDEPAQFLYRLLNLTRSELGAVGEHIDALPQLLAPGFAPFSVLPWLAGWLGLELPRIATEAEARELIARAVALYRRRGTPAGICDFVEINTGVRPSVVEAFEERGTWVLDVASSLGFDTGLPAIDPLGVVVPDAANPLAGGTACCTTPIGAAVVGEVGPLPVSDLGAPLFIETAHRFTVFLPAYRATDAALRAEVRRIIDAEKPAHTDYHLCLVEPDMRVGFQAQVGIDTIVGGPPPPLRLGATRLGVETNLPGTPGEAGHIGQGASVGYTTVLG
jgi:phage tail-like protein